jgi:phosphoglycerate dehydrogenase-like enzyme
MLRQQCVLAVVIGGVIADFTVPADVSGIGKPVHVKTNQEPVQWDAGTHTPIKHHLYDDATTTTYLSHPVTLMKGEAWFTLPDVTTLPMPNPGKPYAIIGMKYDIIDENNRSVPLSELYMHHWLVYDTPTTGTGFNIGCGGEGTFVSNVYGAGGEMRGMDYAYQDGFGYVSKSGKQWWSANLHFINTEDLDTKGFNGNHGAAVKSCIECEYAPGKAPLCVPGLDGSGVFACCVADARCPVNNPKDHSKKKYYLMSTLTWTTDVAKVKHVRMAVIDGVPCGTLTNLKANKKLKGTACDDKICRTEVTRTMPFSGQVQWAYDHAHLGAINASFSVNGVHKCDSIPHVGNDPHNSAGNEMGYLVGFKMCVDPLEKGSYIQLNKGDNVTLVGYYSIDPSDNRSYPIPGGEHTGIMHLFYFMMSDAASTYTCKDDACVPAPGGVPLSTCQMACGPSSHVGPPVAIVFESDQYTAAISKKMKWLLPQGTVQLRGCPDTLNCSIPEPWEQVVAVVGRVPVEMLAGPVPGPMPGPKLTGLKLLQAHSSMYPRLENIPSTVTVANFQIDFNNSHTAEAVGEFVIASAFDWQYQLSSRHRTFSACAWAHDAPKSCPPTDELTTHATVMGTTIGILGNDGPTRRAVAKRALALGLRTVTTEDGVDHDHLFKTSDFIAVTASNDGKRIINATSLGLMKQGAVVIAVSAAAVDFAALRKAILEDRVGAVIDAWDAGCWHSPDYTCGEPYGEPSFPHPSLMTRSDGRGAIVLPGMATRDAKFWQESANFVADNIAALAIGNPLNGVVRREGELLV